MSSVGSKSELLNVLGDVKARVQDKLGIIDFPLPQFILIGKQSVGKSRLIEALAGETFNFISGTLGSRRPTVLEFRHIPGAASSRWHVRDRRSGVWEEHPIHKVMKLVGDAHEELGETVSAEPIYVRIESPLCVDMQIVDLPGFRDFASDTTKQALSDKIVTLVNQFMKDKRNVMLCVEQAGDAATMSTLQRCRAIDPKFERTVLVRNKLDKYYDDLTPDNVGRWVDGYGELPDRLVRFALTLPWWQDGQEPSKSFVELREDADKEDLKQMQAKNLNAKYLQGIGFKQFAAFLEKRIEAMFVDSIGPVLMKLTELRDGAQAKQNELETEYQETDPNMILSTTRDCGVSFAGALTHVMEGVLDLDPVMTLEEELKAFHNHHANAGSTFVMLPSDEFASLQDYIHYLRNEHKLPAFDVQLNGGAQFRRLLTEVEIFLRFSEVTVEVKKRDVFQARGVSVGSTSWRDVIVKLLSKEAHWPLEKRVQYIGERIKWFFECQKEPVLQFMDGLRDTPRATIYSPLYPKYAKLLKQNPMIKHLVFQTYNKACDKQLNQFLDLFNSMLMSTFANPWMALKNGSASVQSPDDDDEQDEVLPTFDDTKERIPKELETRARTEKMLSKRLADISSNAHQVDEAVDKVQRLVLRTFGFIRAQVCDLVETFSESFFKLPMLRRLEEDMALLELSEDDNANYQARRNRLVSDIKHTKASLLEINACIDRLQGFKLRCEARGGGA